jgi:AcrR family transcriptional regulator
MGPKTPTPRERIIEAAARMLAEQGRDALTTRAVAAAAGAHAPTIYRQFGGMRGLLDAVASRGFDSYLAGSVTRERHRDPVDDLRSSWDAHIRFGLTHPTLYVLMFGDPATTIASTAADRAAEILTELIANIARAGRLRVTEDEANAMIRAAGMGVVFQLLAGSAEHRSVAFSHAMREAVLAAVTVEDTPARPEPEPVRQPAADPVVTHAVALRSLLPEADADVPATHARLTRAEAALLREWLDRLADPAAG